MLSVGDLYWDGKDGSYGLILNVNEKKEARILWLFTLSAAYPYRTHTIGNSNRYSEKSLRLLKIKKL